MENEEMMNVPDEENNSFDGSSGDEPGANVPYDDALADSEDAPFNNPVNFKLII